MRLILRRAQVRVRAGPEKSECFRLPNGADRLVHVCVGSDRKRRRNREIASEGTGAR
jgi:hypothetical protein